MRERQITPLFVTAYKKKCLEIHSLHGYFNGFDTLYIKCFKSFIRWHTHEKKRFNSWNNFRDIQSLWSRIAKVTVVRSAWNASKNPRILSPAGPSPCAARDSARLFSRSGALYHADLLFVENLLYAVSPENAYERTRARAITIYRRSFLFGRPCTRGQRENLPRDKFRKSIRFAKHSTAVAAAMLWNTPADVEWRELI